MSSWPACCVGVIAATVLRTQDETTGVLGVLLVALDEVLLLGLAALLGEALLEALPEDALLEDALLVPVLLETGESPEHAARATTARVAGARR
ncbi:hypothetical protein [Janibacter melonis]|uniref:hypothetical protein n=1 Tax=Janibacter melonis TaxID=262209 RepID=UPI00177D7F36